MKVESQRLPVGNVPMKSNAFRQSPIDNMPQKQISRPIEIMFDRPFSDEQKILKYLKTAKIRKIKNKEQLLKKLSEIFRKDLDYIEKLWLGLERTHLDFIGQVTSKLQDEVLRQQYERANYEALHPKREQTHDFSELPSTSYTKNEELNIKDVKPVDGVDIEWKEGKMKPVEQKNYRSKFDEQ